MISDNSDKSVKSLFHILAIFLYHKRQKCIKSKTAECLSWKITNN